MQYTAGTSVAGAARAEGVRYDEDIVKMFLIASVTWAVVGLLVGVIIALQLA